MDDDFGCTDGFTSIANFEFIFCIETSGSVFIGIIGVVIVSGGTICAIDG